MDGHDDALRTDVGGVALRNPVLLASGTAGHLDEMADVLDLSRVGGVVTKSITPLPRPGHATWRIIESRCGLLNAIGLANVGLDAFLEHLAPRIAAVPTAVIGSVAGFRVDDYVQVASAMDELGTLAAIELNLSCPNVAGGLEFGTDTGATREVVAAVRPAVRRTALWVKLSPIALGQPGIEPIARAAVEGAGGAWGPAARPGADALCLTNTVPAMAIDVRTRRPRLANVTGGLSGPAIHPVALRLVYETYRRVAREAGVAIVGIGGVMDWPDAAEFILAGASAVQMGTALFADPRSPLKVVRGLRRWVRAQRVSSIRDLIGAVQATGGNGPV